MSDNMKFWKREIRSQIGYKTYISKRKPFLMIWLDQYVPINIGAPIPINTSVSQTKKEKRDVEEEEK